ncbi:hypothetical protein DTO217A2_7347 [Paecilomyces variotii]|nr:hypothetical protein DTO217A2_7347 [Paecilomyces variotii]
MTMPWVHPQLAPPLHHVLWLTQRPPPAVGGQVNNDSQAQQEPLHLHLPLSTISFSIVPLADLLALLSPLTSCLEPPDLSHLFPFPVR